MIDFATMLSGLWLFGVETLLYLVVSWIDVVGGEGYHADLSEQGRQKRRTCQKLLHISSTSICRQWRAQDLNGPWYTLPLLWLKSISVLQNSGGY